MRGLNKISLNTNIGINSYIECIFPEYFFIFKKEYFEEVYQNLLSQGIDPSQYPYNKERVWEAVKRFSIKKQRGTYNSVGEFLEVQRFYVRELKKSLSDELRNREITEILEVSDYFLIQENQERLKDYLKESNYWSYFRGAEAQKWRVLQGEDWNVSAEYLKDSENNGFFEEVAIVLNNYHSIKTQRGI